jgi:hypothetical protein
MPAARDLILITTFIDDEHIADLLRSVVASNRVLDVLLVVVNQLDLPLCVDRSNPRVRIVEICPHRRLSLSEARNLALDWLEQSGESGQHVMFPDDDSTFDREFFDAWREVVRHGQSYVMLIYNRGTREPFRAFPLPEGRRMGRGDFRYALSVNLIIAAATLARTGRFDERLGVGAEYGGGEDYDFYLRVCRHASFVFTRRLHNFHPATRSQFADLPLHRLLERYRSYSRAYMYLILLHGLYLEIPRSVLRAFLASAWCLATFQVKRGLVQLDTAVVRLGYAVWFGLRRRSLCSAGTNPSPARRSRQIHFRNHRVQPHADRNRPTRKGP